MLCFASETKNLQNVFWTNRSTADLPQISKYTVLQYKTVQSPQKIALTNGITVTIKSRTKNLFFTIAPRVR